MANAIVKVLGKKPPSGQPMKKMQPGDICILTEAPVGHCVAPGEPVLRTFTCHFFLQSRTWCTPDNAEGFYVRDLTPDEEIMITRK